MIRSLVIVALTQFLKDWHAPAMLAGINRDLPTCTRPRKVGINHPLITLKAPGNKVQVSSGTSKTSTTTNNSPMKKYQVTTWGDICLSLAKATMINKWSTSATTTA